MNTLYNECLLVFKELQNKNKTGNEEYKIIQGIEETNEKNVKKYEVAFQHKKMIYIFKTQEADELSLISISMIFQYNLSSKKYKKPCLINLTNQFNIENPAIKATLLEYKNTLLNIRFSIEFFLKKTSKLDMMSCITENTGVISVMPEIFNDHLRDNNVTLKKINSEIK